MARRKSFGQVGNGIVAVVLGVGIFLVWAVPAMLSANASEDWQTAEGVVCEASVVSVRSSGTHGFVTKYRPEVVYEYQVDEKTYTSSQISIGAPTVYKRTADARAALDFKEGDLPTVYFNPSNPAESLLKTGASTATYFPCFFAFGIIAVGSIMAVSPFLQR
ncbi:DUF3592 domain-containing protein [Mariniblastus sp.]|nr:DUF3592 domain-containing protein [Mariniblastus sp.]